MKSFFVIIVLIALTAGTRAQTARDFARKGNEAYKAGEYEKAADFFHKADSLDPNFLESAFNKGDAYFQNGDLDHAIEEFNTVAQNTEDKSLKSKAFHNLGNSFLEKKEYEKSVDAFKNALRVNPSDEDARYNLSYALKKLREQQKKQQDNQDDKKNQDQKKDQQDQNKNQQDKQKKNNEEKKNNDNQENDNQDKKDKKDKKDKDQQENKQQQPKENGDEQKQQPTQPQKGQLSKKDAERMLRANENQEKKTQEKVRQKMLKGEPKKIEKNW